MTIFIEEIIMKLELFIENNPLYSRLPIYFSVFITPLVFIPLLGNLVINAIIALAIVLIVNKKFIAKKWVKLWLISFGLAFAAYVLAFMICSSVEMSWNPGEPSIANHITQSQMQSKSELESTMVYVAVIVAAVSLYLVNFTCTFTLCVKKEERFKIWQRLLFSAIFTVFNAPYLFLFVSVELMEKMGYANDFYNVILH